MKQLCIFLLLCLPCGPLMAQDSLLLADNGKYAYAEIAACLAPAAKYAERLEQLFRSMSMKEIAPLSGGLGYSAAGYFLMRRRSIAAGTPDARIAYAINVEFKEDKYRCLISGFRVSPVVRDRFGVHRAVEGLEVPLEKKPGKLNERLWRQHKAELLDHCKALAAQVKQALSVPAGPPQKAKTISLSSDWQ